VTNHRGIPDAVLVRGVIPERGKETMMERRKTANERILADGPGKLSQAMGIHHRYSGMELNTSFEDGFKVWIEDTGIKMNVSVESGKRVGIDYAGDDALLPWRFKLKKSPLGKK
jgi:DNA-3-methyladenine glycosylase